MLSTNPVDYATHKSCELLQNNNIIFVLHIGPSFFIPYVCLTYNHTLADISSANITYEF